MTTTTQRITHQEYTMDKELQMIGIMLIGISYAFAPNHPVFKIPVILLTLLAAVLFVTHQYGERYWLAK